MRPLVMLAISLAIAMATGTPAATRSIRKDIAVVEKQLQQARQDRETIRSASTQWPRDVRGRQKIDDIEQWAYSAEFESHLRALLLDARGADPVKAKAALAEAQRAMNDASDRAGKIALYWNRGSMINWRDRWKYFALTNEISIEMADPQVLAVDREMIGFLAAGDFAQAYYASQRLEGHLQAAMHDISRKLVAARKPTTLQYRPRSQPCEGIGAQGGEARLMVAASPADYYPAISKRLEEQGDIVITAHVTPTACATEFAIVVSSGYPRLDDAALKVAEASRFAAATENGTAIDGYVTFKVRFVIRND